MEYCATEKWLQLLAEQFVIRNNKLRCARKGSNSIVRQGIAVPIEIDVGNFGYENDGNTRHLEWCRRYNTQLMYIIVANHSVFLATTANGRFKTLEDYKPGDFKNTSNHDSCWRSDGLRDIHSYVMKGYDYCYDHMPEEHKPAPIAANITTSPCILQKGLFKFVEVETQRKSDYGNKITSIKILKEI